MVFTAPPSPPSWTAAAIWRLAHREKGCRGRGHQRQRCCQTESPGFLFEFHPAFREPKRTAFDCSHGLCKSWPAARQLNFPKQNLVFAKDFRFVIVNRVGARKPQFYARHLPLQRSCEECSLNPESLQVRSSKSTPALRAGLNANTRNASPRQVPGREVAGFQLAPCLPFATWNPRHHNERVGDSSYGIERISSLDFHGQEFA